MWYRVIGFLHSWSLSIVSFWSLVFHFLYFGPQSFSPVAFSSKKYTPCQVVFNGKSTCHIYSWNRSNRKRTLKNFLTFIFSLVQKNDPFSLKSSTTHLVHDFFGFSQSFSPVSWISLSGFRWHYLSTLSSTLSRSPCSIFIYGVFFFLSLYLN